MSGPLDRAPSSRSPPASTTTVYSVTGGLTLKHAVNYTTPTTINYSLTRSLMTQRSARIEITAGSSDGQRRSPAVVGDTIDYNISHRCPMILGRVNRQFFTGTIAPMALITTHLRPSAWDKLRSLVRQPQQWWKLTITIQHLQPMALQHPRKAKNVPPKQ